MPKQAPLAAWKVLLHFELSVRGEALLKTRKSFQLDVLLRALAGMSRGQRRPSDSENPGKSQSTSVHLKMRSSPEGKQEIRFASWFIRQLLTIVNKPARSAATQGNVEETSKFALCVRDVKSTPAALQRHSSDRSERLV